MAGFAGGDSLSMEVINSLKTPMEICEESAGPELLEFQRFAAASVAYLTPSSAELQSDTFCNCVEKQEGAATRSSPEEPSEDVSQPFSHLVAQAKAFQFYIVLQEAQQRLEEVDHALDRTSTNTRTTELEKTTRKAVATAIEVYVSHIGDEAFPNKTQRPTTTGGARPGVQPTADVKDSGLPLNLRVLGGGEEVSESAREDVLLVSDTEIERWKWEALSADSEMPTDTEGQTFVRPGSQTSINETFSYEKPGVKKLPSTSERESAGHRKLSLKGDETRPQQTEIAEADDTCECTPRKESNSLSKFDVHSASLNVEVIKQVATLPGSKIHPADLKHRAACRAPAEGRTLCDSRKSSEVAKKFRAEAAERQSLFSLPAGGIRRRRGRKDHHLTGSDNVLRNASSERLVEKDGEDDVTGQLLGLAQEMKVEATRYGEVLQRDNERLQRTGEAQQQYVDETETSTRQTRSLIKGTGFGFLYAMILLIVACALFVSMIAFIFVVRG